MNGNSSLAEHMFSVGDCRGFSRISTLKGYCFRTNCDVCYVGRGMGGGRCLFLRMRRIPLRPRSTFKAVV